MRVLFLLLALVTTAVAFMASQPAVLSATQRTSVAVFGRNDKRTRRGKIYAGSWGNSRRKTKGKTDKIVDPYFSLREWGKRQEPPLSVEEVIALKVAKVQKVKMTQEEALQSIKAI